MLVQSIYLLVSSSIFDSFLLVFQRITRIMNFLMYSTEKVA